MNFITAFQADRLISQIRDEPDPSSPGAKRAFDKLAKLGNGAIPKILEALATADRRHTVEYVELLNRLTSDKTLPLITRGLAGGDPRTVAGTARALSTNKRYDVNRLVDLLGKDDFSKSAIIEILTVHKDRLDLHELFAQVYYLQPAEKSAVFRLIDELATEELVPALLQCMDGKDAAVKMYILDILSKFDTPEVHETMIAHLKDNNKHVRRAALAGIAKRQATVDVEMIRGPLRELVKDDDETIRRAAVEILSTRGDKRTVDRLVQAVKDEAPSLRPQQPAMAPAAASAGSGADRAQTLLVEDRNAGGPVTGRKQHGAIDIPALTAGDVIEGRYKFIRKIGNGAFGTVLLVEDTVVEEWLILKFLNPDVASDEEMMKRFVHELRYSRRITHKNVIRIYDFLYLGGGYAISMEYFPSHTLGFEIANDNPMSPNKAVRYALDVCTGMHVAHQQGIIHRDLKPANLLIDNTGLLKIVDFGVAAAAKSGDTQLAKAGYVIGSPKYMAPEQILGKTVDERADIYSLGVIMYEMLAGSPPYSHGDHMAVMYQHVRGKAPPLTEIHPNVPEELSAIVAKAMLVDKTQRFASMEELRQALAEVGPKLREGGGPGRGVP